MQSAALIYEPEIPAPRPFTDPGLEMLYQAERAQLATSSPRSRTRLVLIGSLASFILLPAVVGLPVVFLVLVAAVLALHEAGHWVGMRIFGYRDPRMYFVPFFGAATVGRPSGAGAWQQGIVVLLGPLPGIALSLLLLILASSGVAPGLLRLAALALVCVNGINLLPLGSLDGGRFFQRVLFSRHRHLELVFLSVSGLGLLLFMLALHQPLLALFAVAGLAALPRRARVLELAHRLREGGALVDADLATVPDEVLRPIFLAAYDALPGATRLRPGAVAGLMEELVDVARPAPSCAATCVLLGAWIATTALTLHAAALLLAVWPRSWAM
jgi:Zn-dependent protease